MVSAEQSIEFILRKQKEAGIHKFKQKNLIYVTLLVAIILLLGNILIFFSKDDGYYYNYTNYATLYYPQNIPKITGLEVIKRDQLLIKLSLPSRVDKWNIIPASKEQYSVTGSNPTIKLLDGTGNYLLSPLKTAGSSHISNIRLTINYTPAEIYEQAGNHTISDNYHIVHSSVPIGKFKQYSLEEFTYTKDMYPQEDIKEGLEISRSIRAIADNDPTELKIKKLSLFLLDALEGKSGIPTDEMQSISAYKQFISAYKDMSPIWCSNYADIYVFFANLMDIPTRKVLAGGKLGVVNISGHAFAESYIKEKEQWAFVDLTSKKLFIKNENGDFLNTVDLFNINKNKTYNGIRALVYKNKKEGAVLRLYSEVANSEKYYFNNNVTFLFPFSYKQHADILHVVASKAYRYIFKPEPVYSLQSGSNIKYYVKVAFFWGELLASLLLSFLLIKRLWAKAA